MAQQFTYNYAVIDDTGLCMEVCSVSSSRDDNPYFIAIPEYSDEYIFKYYNRETGLWYEDAAFTIEWSPEV